MPVNPRIERNVQPHIAGHGRQADALDADGLHRVELRLTPAELAELHRRQAMTDGHPPPAAILRRRAGLSLYPKTGAERQADADAEQARIDGEVRRQEGGARNLAQRAARDVFNRRSVKPPVKHSEALDAIVRRAAHLAETGGAPLPVPTRTQCAASMQAEAARRGLQADGDAWVYTPAAAQAAQDALTLARRRAVGLAQ